MKKITKKQSKEFNDKVKDVILSAGFENKPDGFYEYTKDTNFGKVKISLHDQTGSEIYSIFTRFDDIEKALRIFNCNRYTGKYNFHSADAQEILGMFEFYLHELATFGKES